MSFQPVIKMINAGPNIIDACNQFIFYTYTFGFSFYTTSTSDV